MTKQFRVVFQPFSNLDANKVVLVEAEHENDINVSEIGDNIDPGTYNSADWHITSVSGHFVLKCSTAAA
jgi:methionine-rich copper-binding protein CopC